MTDSAPLPRRSTVTDVTGGLQISIPARRNWLLIVFLAVYLVGWAIGEFIVSRELGQVSMDGRVGPFLAVFLVVWSAIGVFSIYLVLWNLLGVEVVTIGRDGFLIKRQMLGVGRPRLLDLARIKNLRLAPQEDTFFGMTRRDPVGLSSGMLAFEHRGRTYRIANGVDADEAQHLLERIQTRFNLNRPATVAPAGADIP